MGSSTSGSSRGTYTLPGGSVAYGESLEQALKREVREETHLDVLASCPVSFFFSHFADRPWVLNVVGWVCNFKGRVRNREFRGFGDWGWLQLSSIPAKLPMDVFYPNLVAIEHFRSMRMGRLRWRVLEENVRGIDLSAKREFSDESLPLPFWEEPACE